MCRWTINSQKTMTNSLHTHLMSLKVLVHFLVNKRLEHDEIQLIIFCSENPESRLYPVNSNLVYNQRHVQKRGQSQKSRLQL